MKLAEFKTWPTQYRMLSIEAQSFPSLPRVSWSQRYEEQGFQWSPEEITFVTFYDGDREGWICIEVFLLTEFKLGDDAERALRLPFDVSVNETVVVTVLFDEDPRSIHIPTGSYALYYETGLLRPFDQLQKEDEELDLDDEEALTDPTVWCRLTFVPQQDAQPAILRADPGFSPLLPLLLDRPPQP